LGPSYWKPYLEMTYEMVGDPVPYMVKDNEGHGFHNEENQFDFYEAMESSSPSISRSAEPPCRLRRVASH